MWRVVLCSVFNMDDIIVEKVKVWCVIRILYVVMGVGVVLLLVFFYIFYCI